MLPLSIYDFSFRSITGRDISMGNFRDHVILIVNTASKCGFTPQFKDLESLYLKYLNRKFIVIGFPCNQFQNQDPGTNNEINTFCEVNYGITFPMSEKIEVNGPNTHPLYKFLKKNSRGIFGTEKIKWNFTKFLIDRNGNILKRFAPYTTPSQISSYIEKVISPS